MRPSLCHWLQNRRITSEALQSRYRKRRRLQCLASDFFIQHRFSQVASSIQSSSTSPASLLDDPSASQEAMDAAIQKVRTYAESFRNDPTADTSGKGYNPENPGSLHWRVALSVLEECILQRVPISTSFSARVMSLLARAGRIDHAEVLFEAIIGRRGGMSLQMNHVRPILKYYIKNRMPADAKRIYDVTRAFLHDPNILWLLYYMMKLYDSIDDFDGFENTFRMAQDMSEERERQLCHMVLMDALIKRAPAEAVLTLYEQMKESGMDPVGQIMIRLFRCFEAHRMGEVAWRLYQDDFHPKVLSRKYNFDTWVSVTSSLIKASVLNFHRLVETTPAPYMYRLLWVVEAPEYIDYLVERLIDIEGYDGPSRVALTKALVRRLDEETDSERIIALFEKLPKGDTKLFPRYLEALLATGQSAKIVQLFYAEPERFLLPASTSVALRAIYEAKDGIAAIGVARLILQACARGRGITRQVLDSALMVISQLRPLEDLQSIWNTLTVQHLPILRSHTYLVASTCFLRHGQDRLAFQLLAEALILCDSQPLLRVNFVAAMRQFIAARLIMPTRVIFSDSESRQSIYGDEARSILADLRYIFARYSVEVHVEKNGKFHIEHRADVYKKKEAAGQT